MKYFTIKSEFFLVPPPNLLKEYEKIDKFMSILEKSGVSEIIKSVKTTDEKCKGRNGYNPFNLFATIIYCFSNFKSSIRDIEDKFYFDMRVHYIMEGKTPGHSTIGDFINKYILPYQYEIFTLINKQIIKELNLNIDNVFLDGTKIEANANKYKFVWKPIKFHKRLDKKIKDFLFKIGYDYSRENNFITSKEFNDILNNYMTYEDIIVEDIPYGRGCRRTISQKNYIEGSKYLLKLIEYEEKEKICGDRRNSYYKTDKDATAMMLKEDYYSKLSNDFHAGYNIQVFVSSLLIIMYGVFQDRSDHYTFIPMNDLYFKYYKSYPKNECADSGYGIHKNYDYMKKHNIENYVKFQQWKGEASGKRPQLFKVDNNNDVVCLNNKIGSEVETNSKPKIKGGKFYIWEGCNDCNYVYKCKQFFKNKNKDYRIREISIQYEKYKEEARKNLLSPKGIKMRINRSIQVEGTFGQLKQNMSYNRIRRRGLEKVSCEIMLECLGINIKRYLNSIEEEKNKFKENCWNAPIDLQSEKFPSVKSK